MKKIILSVTAVYLLSACGGSEQPATVTQEDTKTEISKPENTPVKKDDKTTLLTVSKDSSSVLTWTGSAVGKEHYGTVDYKGSLNITESNLISGELIFDMMTISSKDLEGEWKEKLDGHLMASDFFNVDSFPTAKLAINGYDGTNLNADLTIKEVTKTISVPASVTIKDGNLEGSAEFAINRTDYGVVYGSGNFFDLAKDKVISDDIKFKFLIKAGK